MRELTLSTALETADQELTTPLPSLHPSDVVLWSGAGISIPAPTNLPSGPQLTKTAIDHAFLPGTWGTLVNGYFGPAGLVDANGDAKLLPRLEAVLESATLAVGYSALEVLAPCGIAVPNDRHEMLAAHVADGGTHVTVNFDTCIERCLLAADWHRVVHVHGTYDHANLEKLGARISTVANGLPTLLSRVLVDLLHRVRAIAFLGYSGSDYFDVTPFFRALPGQGVDLSHLDVVWVKHNPGSPQILRWPRRDQGSAILEALAQCGARVTYILGDAQPFLEGLLRAWGLQSRPKPSGQGVNRQVARPIGRREQVLATGQLYTSMGIGREVVSLEAELVGLMRQVQRASREWTLIQFILNDGFRNVGFYRKAISYARALAEQSSQSRVVSTQRLAGDLWLSGDYAGAALRFESALRRAAKERGVFAPQTPEYSQWSKELAEIRITYLHCLRDIRRHGAIWRMIVSSYAACTYKGVLDSRDVIGDSPHSLAKLIRLYRELDLDRHGVPFPSEIEERYPQLRDVFHETDSFTGAVNYLRRELTNQFQQSQPLSAPALDHLHGLSELIDDRPGMLKAALLRRAALGLDTPGIDRVLREIHWSRWYKMKWRSCWKRREPWWLN